MMFYDNNGLIVCEPCRDDMLAKFGPTGMGENNEGVNPDERLQLDDFVPIGEAPWANNIEPDRYIQCDECTGQWGPDA